MIRLGWGEAKGKSPSQKSKISSLQVRSQNTSHTPIRGLPIADRVAV
ncbi:hypothetical protein [Chroococcidiopsis sp. SAG 2025]|nr:hypothetical protein [Chroococcidiopsis sp. SAG 2025]